MNKKVQGKLDLLLASQKDDSVEMYRATFYVTKDAFLAFKAACKKRDISMSQVIEAFMSDFPKKRLPGK